MADKKKNYVPNVAPKMDPKEQARLQAMIGNLRAQDSQVVAGEKGVKRELAHQGEGEKAAGGGLNIEKIPTIYIKGCSDCEYIIAHRTKKIMIEACENVKIRVTGKIMTATVEIWRGGGIQLSTAVDIKTLQLDILRDCTVHFDSTQLMHALVWQNVETLSLSFGDDENSSLVTGFEHMKKLLPDSNVVIDQFIVRFVDDVITPERCVRLKNGFLSTEREAADWERRNEAARDKHLAQFMKKAGINLNKSDEKKIPRNKPCPCGSGHKYKKCCAGKKEITGLAKNEQGAMYSVTKQK